MAYKWGFRPDEGAAFFQSYSRYDWYRAAAIAKELNGMGYPVWYDDGLTVGDREWREQISLHIKQSCAVIIYVTQELLTRDDTYVINEYLEAQERGKTVIIVFLDNININNISDKYSGYYIEWKRQQALLCAGKSSKETARLISNEIIKKKIQFGGKYGAQQPNRQGSGSSGRTAPGYGSAPKADPVREVYRAAAAKERANTGNARANAHTQARAQAHTGSAADVDPIQAVYRAAAANSKAETGRYTPPPPPRTAVTNEAGRNNLKNRENAEKCIRTVGLTGGIELVAAITYVVLMVAEYNLTGVYYNILWLVWVSVFGTSTLAVLSAWDITVFMIATYRWTRFTSSRDEYGTIPDELRNPYSVSFLEALFNMKYRITVLGIMALSVVTCGCYFIGTAYTYRMANIGACLLVCTALTAALTMVLYERLPNE